jgi:hypothetical protein
MNEIDCKLRMSKHNVECNDDSDNDSFADYGYSDDDETKLRRDLFIFANAHDYESDSEGFDVSVSDFDCDNSLSTSELLPSNWRETSGALVLPNTAEDKKGVRFEFVNIREYNVTVGAHSAVCDTCPLQLSWEHSLDLQASLSDHSRQRIQKKRHKENYPRRLSLKERRERIAFVQEISVKEVQTLEHDIVMQQILDVMKATTVASQKMFENYQEPGTLSDLCTAAADKKIFEALAA